MTSPDGLPVKISEAESIAGLSPIIILGPNGAGKTRHAVNMAGWNNANMIAALRNIALPPDVSMRPMQQATQELNSHLNRRRSSPWELSNEINDLFSKLMAEDSAAAIRFRDSFTSGAKSDPDITKLMMLQGVWTRLFPGRHIDFTEYRPRVRSDYTTVSGEYLAQYMSDGERVALYLAARVLDSDQKVIIVDEPEVHFHSRLAARFWNEMEKLRSDCRFVYITHDLPFALSRKGATFVVLMPNATPQVVSFDTGLPKEVAESLLAAASFSIHAKRIVFCEGIEGPSIDQALYSAWFHGPDTAVIPVESGVNVVRCTQAFSESTFMAGVTAVGILDRDYWPDLYLQSLPTGVFVLPVHEVEGLLCIESIFVAVANHLGQSAADAADKYKLFLDAARAMFKDGLLNKQISERFRTRCEHEHRLALNKLAVVNDIAVMKAAHTSALEPSVWETPPADIFSEEENRIASALSGTSEEFLKYFPGKVILGKAATALGISSNSYLELICSALKAEDGDPLYDLGKKLDAALSSYLPSRS